MGDYLSSDNEHYHEDDNGDFYDDDDGDDSSVGFQALETELLSAYATFPPTKVITKESLLAAQREDLHRVMDLLSLKEHHARTLLIHYCWDVDKVLAVLVEYGKDKLFAAAGVQILDHHALASYQLLSSTFTCNICYEDVLADMLTVMDCGHYFCNDCWTEHFIVKINEGQSRRIRCMALKCNACSCLMWELWSKKCQDESETVNWIAINTKPCPKCQDESETVNWITINTKPCPKCHKPVEKNGGCNHVSWVK